MGYFFIVLIITAINQFMHDRQWAGENITDKHTLHNIGNYYYYYLENTLYILTLDYDFKNITWINKNDISR